MCRMNIDGQVVRTKQHMSEAHEVVSKWHMHEQQQESERHE